MKINDLLTESHNLDEFDMPVFGKKAKMIRKAEKAGAADAAQSVNDLTSEFASHLGTQGKKFNTATTDDVIAFLQSKKVDTSKIDATQPMDKKRIGVIFNTLIKDKMAGKDVAGGGAPKPKTDPKVLKSVYAQTKANFAQLTKKEKTRLLTALQKELNAKPKGKQPVA